MNDNEVNKIIAEFMGAKICEADLRKGDLISPKGGTWYIGKPYTESLDVLVPVWEKLGKIGFTIEMLPQGNTYTCLIYHRDEYIGDTQVYCDDYSIYTAAAHATAKAIQELSKE